MKKIHISENLKNVGRISFGTIIGQLISLFSIPLLTRIYGPKIIGNWAFINSISMIINSFSDLGLSNAIMTEENDENVNDVYKIISTIGILIILILCLIIFVFKYNFQNRILLMIDLVCIFIFSVTSQQIQISYIWLNRKKKYNILMKNPLINNSCLTLIAILLSVLGNKNYGYYIAIIISQFITLIHMKKHIPMKLFIFDYDKYKFYLKKNINFILYQMPSTVILQFKGQLPTFLIKSLFGAEILGYYSVAVRLLNMPISLLAKSLGNVFFQIGSELKRKNEDIGEYLLVNINNSMKLATIPIILLLSFGDLVIYFLFGNYYQISATLLRIMTFYGFFLFLSMSVNGIAILLEKQKYTLISGISQIVLFSIGIIFGKIFFNSIYFSIFLMSISFCLIQIIYFCIIFKETQINLKRYLKPLIIQTIVIVIFYIMIRYCLYYFNLVNSF